MSLMMRAEVLDEVVKRLRSGDYEQGQSALRVKGNINKPDTYCCLGVLCEMAVEAGVVLRREQELEGHTYGYISTEGGQEDSAYLPAAVIEWAGIVSDVMKNPSWGEYHYESRGHFDDGDFDSLAVMNDSGSYNFHAIADWMEQNVVRV